MKRRRLYGTDSITLNPGLDESLSVPPWRMDDTRVPGLAHRSELRPGNDGSEPNDTKVNDPGSGALET